MSTKTTRFASLLLSQSIFRLFDDSSENLLHNSELLVSRNNTELYFAYKTWIRCCTVGNVETGFKMIDLTDAKLIKQDDHIKSLSLNSLNSLLAAVRDKAISVVVLPENLLQEKGVVEPRVFNIKLSSEILKTTWHSGLSKDSTLVILTKCGLILCYDVMESTVVPSLSIDLKKSSILKGANPVSISFGNDGIIGALTLYVACDDHQIYSLYPFIPPTAKIVATKEQIDSALQVSLSIVDAVDKAFPYLETFPQSALKTRALFQYEFFQAMETELNSSTSFTEVRNTSSTNPQVFSVFKNHKRESPVLQGPVAKLNSSIFDISAVGKTLMAISESNGKAYSSYLAQLRPLLMEWDDTVSLRKPNFVAPVEPAVLHGYKKIKRGFGYINMSDDEDDSQEYQEYLEKKRIYDLSIARVDDEIEFAKNELLSLTTLQVDSFSGSPGSKIRTVAKDKFFLVIGNKIVFGDAESWVSSFDDIIYGTEEKVSLNTKFKTLPNEASKTYAVTFLTDVDSENDDYVVVCSSKKETDANIVCLFDDYRIVRSREEKPVKGNKNINIPARESMDEITKDLNVLKDIYNKLCTNVSNVNQTIEGTVPFLNDFNKVSNEVGDVVGRATSVGLRIYSRVNAQVDELRTYVETMRYVNEHTVDQKQIKENEARVQKSGDRQKAIEERFEHLEKKLRNINFKVKKAKSMPLSKAEKEWFKQINDLSERMGLKKDSYPSQVESLKSQVKQLSQTLQNKDGNESMREVLKQYEMNGRLSMLLWALRNETDSLERTRADLEVGMKKLAI